MLTIVHGSDVHFGPPYVPAAGEAFLRSVEELDPDVIVLSGEVGDGQHDVVNKGHILFGRAGGKLETNRFLKQQLVQGHANITGLMREDIDGSLQRQLNWGSYHTMRVGSRTNADLLREVGSLAGLQLSQFGLPSQNKGSVLSG